MSLLMTVLKEDVQQIISVCTMYELVLYSEFRTSTVAPNKGFMILFATAPYLIIARMCSAAYLTFHLDS